MPDNATDLDLARSLDPVTFARAVGIRPYPWQVAALRSTDQREAWVCARQTGKSTTAALLATHRLIYGLPGSTIVAVSVGQRQSTALVAQAKEFYRRIGAPLGALSDREGSMTVENGSRLVSLPGGGEGGASLRGLSAHLLLVDEASRVPDSVYAAIRPFLAVTAGRILALSTPWTEQGWYAAAALGRDPGWTVRRVHAEEVLDPGFLAAEKASMIRTDFEREYGLSFSATTSSLWSTENWDALLDTGAPMRSNLMKAAEPKRPTLVVTTFGAVTKEKA